MDSIFIISILDEDETVGTGLLDDKLLRVYPNPAKDKASIENLSDFKSSWDLRLHDLSGKILLSVDNITGSRYELDCSKFSKGLYFLEICGEDRFRIKLIIE